MTRHVSSEFYLHKPVNASTQLTCRFSFLSPDWDANVLECGGADGGIPTGQLTSKAGFSSEDFHAKVTVMLLRA
ncbi:uncharacterized protein BP01DRAFT_387111 [Aspergillus saccharolyticus JOP 1030-1]|uniref:Uncharacterized protein n=1 Tax=Aspergillus saccharolyticus JOP 1030-1 TaxID=1450539 RepID=A0A318Z351_9EURO|nr:hypothetical protein BP01DRAFT_387111 [Aspergillus saccharolyticus JOP 1030-1]PYH40717.1 hypothetical protein BP01DRAFT_387111 [Aspergillus saccharolyticus JOP 1030-1]